MAALGFKPAKRPLSLEGLTLVVVRPLQGRKGHLGIRSEVDTYGYSWSPAPREGCRWSWRTRYVRKCAGNQAKCRSPTVMSRTRRGGSRSVCCSGTLREPGLFEKSRPAVRDRRYKNQTDPLPSPVAAASHSITPATRIRSLAC